MRAYDIIKKKRDGYELSKEEIRFFVNGYVSGEIPSYQTSALLMAIFFRGMTQSETAELTFAVRDSGEVISRSTDGIKVDKHSTGGVGDKTSLIVMPIVASCGLKVAKMSGRGLGHTGGTIDKLESIQGFNTDIPSAKFSQIVKDVGLSIVGQSATLAPADKLLYALRDVTATVDSIPLIASSIMGKKLAANDDVIVLDVKCGSGAFMKTLDEAKQLASVCVDVGKKAGKKVSALITDMDKPLGRAIGNSLEVIEAVEILKGGGASDLRELSLTLAAEILRLSGYGTADECVRLAKERIDSHKALDTFVSFVKAQGGNEKWIFDTSLFPSARHSLKVVAPLGGYVTAVNAEEYGVASSLLGAGRTKLGEKIDFSAGIILNKKTGDYVSKGEEIATLYFNEGDEIEAANKILRATQIGDVPPKKRPMVLEVIN